MPAYEISTFSFIHVYYPSLLLSALVKSGLTYPGVISNAVPTAQHPLLPLEKLSPERGCDLSKAAEQFTVEAGLEPGAPSVFLRNQRDCPWRHRGQTGAAQETRGLRMG